MKDHQNSVQFLGHFGSDTTIAESAWVSTGQEALDEIEPKTGKPRKERIPQLLASLAKDGHHTPFEQCSLRFLITGEIATHIHFLKHRIGNSINSESARYKELQDDKFYVPQDWPLSEQENFQRFMEDAIQQYHLCMESLVKYHSFTRKRAKESARFYLPYANQIKWVCTLNWRSFHHMLGLRMKDTAQDEVHLVVAQMLWHVSNIEGRPFRHTIKAFGHLDFGAPTLGAFIPFTGVGIPYPESFEQLKSMEAVFKGEKA
jgi:flavin-dependent thymidylate synthase